MPSAPRGRRESFVDICPDCGGGIQPDGSCWCNTEEADLQCGWCMKPLGYCDSLDLRVRDRYCSDACMEAGELAADEAAEYNGRGPEW